MDPNSRNQIWSRWTFTVTPAKRQTFASVRENCARFARRAFGSSTEMKITQAGPVWTIDIRTERHPVHDDQFVIYMREQWVRFFVNGFGAGTAVTLVRKLEAGSRQNGTPPDQLIILPTITATTTMGGI